MLLCTVSDEERRHAIVERTRAFSGLRTIDFNL
jgi:hypothetical protein